MQHSGTRLLRKERTEKGKFGRVQHSGTRLSGKYKWKKVSTGECNTPEPDYTERTYGKKARAGECDTPEPDSSKKTGKFESQGKECPTLGRNDGASLPRPVELSTVHRLELVSEKLRTRRKLLKPNESLFHGLPTICRLEIVHKKNEKQEEVSRLIPLEGIRSCYVELPSSAAFRMSCLRLLSQCCCLPTAYQSPATTRYYDRSSAPVPRQSAPPHCRSEYPIC